MGKVFETGKAMKLQLTDRRKNKFIALEIGLLIGISILLRIVNLGYSNFQGDEISALCSFSEFKTRGQFLIYLLGQRKGPVQYLITCALSLFDPTFSSELAMRLPFAIVNLLAMICFFIVIYRLFSLQIAIYSSFLFATNGIFIAFARIVQYQSIVLMTGTAGILGLVLALQYEKWKAIGLYLAFISVAMGLLTHFDAFFILPPIAVLVVHWWIKFHKRPDFPLLRMHLIAAIILSAFLVLAFYIPYVERLGSYQTDYWQERFTGEPTNIFRVIEFYNPGPFLWFCLGSILTGLTQIRKSLGWQVILAWILPALIFMVVIFKDSRTHAYTYLLPLLIIGGIGIERFTAWLQGILRDKYNLIARGIILGVFLFFSYLSYMVFIDHNPEYPWYPKQVLGVSLDESHVAGIFGFPYSRDWQEIGNWFDQVPTQNTIVVVNEKLDIPTFYLPPNVHYKYLTEEAPGRIKVTDGVYFVLVQKPIIRMNMVWGWSLDEWRNKVTPLHDFVDEDGQIVASIYFLTQQQIDADFH